MCGTGVLWERVLCYRRFRIGLFIHPVGGCSPPLYIHVNPERRQSVCVGNHDLCLTCKTNVRLHKSLYVCTVCVCVCVCVCVRVCFWFDLSSGVIGQKYHLSGKRQTTSCWIILR